MFRTCAATALLALLAACSNESNTELHFGSVSVGQQLIDLDEAHKAGAIDDAEYQAAKRSVLRMVDEVANSLDQ
ncbi:MAG: SHOCT domain-containing protein [Pseudomonadota bacterium]